MKFEKIRKGLAPTCIALVILTFWVAGAPAAQMEEVAPWSGRLSLGYRAVDTQKNFRRAIEYTRAESGPTAGVELRGISDHGKFYLETEYLNDAEYRAETGFDFKGLFRLDLFAQSLWHNLDHIPYDPLHRPVPTSYVDFSDLNPGDNYHLQVHQSGAKVRAGLPRYPAHFNLAYWRIEREGKRQLRFADEGNGSLGSPPSADCFNCHVKSRTHNVDRVTQEITGGFDAHLGAVNIVLEQLYREFRDREPIPVDTFGSHRYRTGPADLQHDEAPESKLTETTLKLHTSPAGGLFAGVTLGAGEMKSQSELTDVRPANAETDFRKAAGDVTYTPSEHWTFNFRYRFLDLDTDNPDRITVSASALSQPLPVRDSIDLERAHYEAVVSFRPARKVTLKGEYRRVEIDRSNTGGPFDFRIDSTTAPPTALIDPVWELPEEERIDRFRLSVLARPLDKGRLKLNAWYQYETSDDPAYGTSTEKGHTVFAGGAWTPSRNWGLLVNGRYAREENEKHTLFLPNETGTFSGFRQDREREAVQAVSGLWLLPAEAVSLSLNYGFLLTRITQDLLFGTLANTDPTASANYAIVAEDADYHQRVHTVSFTAAWRILENLRGRLETRYIHSTARFSPDFFVPELLIGGTLMAADSSLLREISEVDIRQTGIQIGLDWSPAPRWTVSAGFSHDDYDDRNADVFDGSAQFYTASLARSW